MVKNFQKMLRFFFKKTKFKKIIYSELFDPIQVKTGKSL